ncbi:FecR family protein [Mucilaginibacter endophyticus]|uniref:FecR family protein n=1 Tax=Mucilaginibacter endophyticus TaxID=2675003 RepID=UPI000E0D6304|nr:FecR family protein [Mucilaginibacter endophyticus]
MDLKKINELIKKFIEGTASQSEEDSLMEWYRGIAYRDSEFPIAERDVYEAMRKKIEEAASNTRVINWKKWSLAACLFLVAGFGITNYWNKQKKQDENSLAIHGRDKPGQKRITLTLSTGITISLTGAHDGLIALDGNTQIVKPKDGQLTYKAINLKVTQKTGRISTNKNGFNILETPAGAQFLIILPDHSKVWLNSSSSLKYPNNFDNLSERRVELTGEGYFEVVHDQKKPFKVATESSLTEDIGTEFNVSAYHNDGFVKTTLVKGAASISAGGSKTLLSAGQQAIFKDVLKVSNVNVENEIAWKNGFFQFDNMKLEQIMKVLGRWYDFEYSFTDESLKDTPYGAVIANSSSLSSLLELLEKIGDARFEYKENKVTVYRKH